MATFVPVEVFPPGYIIQEELQARGWSQTDLAEIMGRPVQAINEIINARKRVTEDTARELEQALGIDAEIWLKTEALFRLHQAEPAPKAIAQRAALRQRVPLRQFISRGWIQPTDSEAELRQRVLNFLGVLRLEDRPTFAMAAKQTVYGEPLTSAQEAWLVRVRQLAKSAVVARYSEAKLEAVIDRMYPLLRVPDEVRHVPRLLAEAGVRFVVVEQLPGLKIDAVCTWLSPTEPVIGMSLMRDRIDNFWFGVRHECEHVLNGDGKDATIVDNDMDTPDDTSDVEKAANIAAADFCVPQHLLTDFIDRKGPLIGDDEIRRFARDIERHSGLVAGQLRRRLNAWNKYTSHLARVRHIVVGTATVDGFGVEPQVG